MKHPNTCIARVALASLAAAVMLVSSGCGRKLPVIDAETLNSKKAVLVMTAQSVSQEETELIRKVSAEQSRTGKISMDFVEQMSTNPEDVTSRIESNDYDGIIAAGDELSAPLIQAALKETDKKFILLGNGVSPAIASSDVPSNVSVSTLDESRKTAVWSSWVSLQDSLGAPVLWISRTSSPIPVEWAPEEEADRLLMLDIYPGDSWLSQLAYQANAVKAHWIAVFTQEDQETMSKLGSLDIPVVEMASGIEVKYNWQQIIAESFARYVSGDWQGGENFYTDAEALVTRK